MRSPSARAGFVASIAVGLAACTLLSGPDSEVSVVVAAAHFEFNEDVRFEVRNHLEVPIRLDVCSDDNIQIALLQRIQGRRGAASA